MEPALHRLHACAHADQCLDVCPFQAAWGRACQGSRGPSSSQQQPQQGASSGKRGKGGKGGGETGGRRKSSKKDELRSKNREAQRRFREKQKCALGHLPWRHVTGCACLLVECMQHCMSG